jgi:hypothetical protein
MVKPVTDTPRKSAHFHAVRFYENAESLCNIVAEFLGEGLVIGQPALIIGTPEHRAGVVEALRARHFDVDRMETAGDLLMLDGRDTLAMFMEDEVPNDVLFHATMTDAVERLCRGRTHCTIRAYGELVDLLWKDAHTIAAVQVEMMWNKLAATHDFSLLCGYAMGHFYKDASVYDICRQHTHIVGPDGTAAAATYPTVN